MTFHSCWEQRVIFFITTPIQLIASIIYLILTPIFVVCGILRLPMLVITLAMTVLWLPALGVILLCSKISQSRSALRPASFALALPFLIFGHFLVSLEPIIVRSDAEGKMEKLRLIESFPYCII